MARRRRDYLRTRPRRRREGIPTAHPLWHEICTDVVSGVPVSVTSCPLTGAATGFEHGGTTFGISGELVSSNLVMYDRATDSQWPQMLATAIEGPFEGRSLREFRLAWRSVRRSARRNSRPPFGGGLLWSDVPVRHRRSCDERRAYGGGLAGTCFGRVARRQPRFLGTGDSDLTP